VPACAAAQTLLPEKRMLFQPNPNHINAGVRGRADAAAGEADAVPA
jgi:hypothetical protein